MEFSGTSEANGSLTPASDALLRGNGGLAREPSAPNCRPNTSEVIDRSDARHSRPGSSDAAPVELTDAWIRQIYPSIHRMAWTLTGDVNAAEDLAQETFVAALQQWDRFEGKSKRSTWVHGITVRLSRKHFRSLARLRRRLERVFANTHPTTHDNNHADALAEEEWRKSIWSTVAQLPRLQAEAITLRFGSELSYEDIADAMNCPVGTAKTRVHQGLQKLRQSHSFQFESPGLES